MFFPVITDTGEGSDGGDGIFVTDPMGIGGTSDGSSFRTAGSWRSSCPALSGISDVYLLSPSMYPMISYVFSLRLDYPKFPSFVTPILLLWNGFGVSPTEVLPFSPLKANVFNIIII